MPNHLQNIHTWLFGDMPFADILRRIKSTGADGIDLSIHKDGIYSAERLLEDADENVRLLDESGLRVLSSTPLFFSKDIDLSSSDAEERRSAVCFAKRAADVSARYGSDRMLIAPSWVSVMHSLDKPYETHWNYALDTVRDVAAYAEGIGVSLLIEPINRYRVSLVHTAEEALRFAGETGAGNVHVVLDVFHMHMEEADGVVNAIHAVGDRLKCLHIGDNTRRPPGFGVFDWRAVLAALAAVHFDGPLSYETVYLYFSEKRVAADEAYADEFTEKLRRGISHLSGLMEIER
jgi:D-psicose/D-tagatose/L-ribulose 3-epimerase